MSHLAMVYAVSDGLVCNTDGHGGFGGRREGRSG